MKKVCIIGLGWLGETLGERLKESNIYVSGTTTEDEKLNRLKKKFDVVVKFNLEDLESTKENLKDIALSDTFVLTIPPSTSEAYSDQLIELCHVLKSFSPEALIIYTSSTSVYGHAPKEVNEDSSTDPYTENAIKIVQFERALLSYFPGETTIIRLGGLIGGDRHPINFLIEKKSISKPFAPVNLVYKDDAISFIYYLIEKGKTLGVCNLCSSNHPSKQEYYTWVAKQKKIDLPKFKIDDRTLDKVVICNVVEKIGFQLKYDSPFEYPL